MTAIRIIPCVLSMLSLLYADGQVALVGIHTVPTDEKVQKIYREQIPPGSGLTVHELVSNTHAAKALKRGDVLLRAEGQILHKAEDLAHIISSKSPGDTIRLEVLRNGSIITVAVQLSAKTTQPELTRAQTTEINRLLLLLVPHGQSPVNVPEVRRQMLKLAALGLALKDEYSTCTLYMSNGQHITQIRSTERELSIRCSAEDTPNVTLRADYYKRSSERLPVKLEQQLLQSSYHRP